MPRRLWKVADSNAFDHSQALENDLCCTPAAPRTTKQAGNYHGGASSTPLATTTAGRTAPRWPATHSALVTPSSSRASHPLLEALENDFECAAPSEGKAFEKDLSPGKVPVSALNMLEADLSSSIEAAAEPESSAASWQALLREMLSRGDLAENNHRLLAPISKCAACGFPHVAVPNAGPVPLYPSLTSGHDR